MPLSLQLAAEKEAWGTGNDCAAGHGGVKAKERNSGAFRRRGCASQVTRAAPAHRAGREALGQEVHHRHNRRSKTIRIKAERRWAEARIKG